VEKNKPLTNKDAQPWKMADQMTETNVNKFHEYVWR
jgi:hypothetical protein